MGEYFVNADLAEYPDEPVTRIDREGEKDMTYAEERIKELDAEIESYREAIMDAEAALDSAEKELNEVLAELS